MRRRSFSGLLLAIAFACLLSSKAHGQGLIDLGSTCVGAGTPTVLGTINIPVNQFLQGLQFTRINGSVSCTGTCGAGTSFWGCCTGSTAIGMVVTDTSANVVLPDYITSYYTSLGGQFYTFPGSNHLSNVLYLPWRGAPFVTSAATTLRVYYGEVYTGNTVTDNSGVVCFQVQGVQATTTTVGNVCYGAAVGTSGNFSVPGGVNINGFVLTRTSGSILAGTGCGTAYWGSGAGCVAGVSSMSTFITNSSANSGLGGMIVPEFNSGYYRVISSGAGTYWYNFNGSNALSASLVLPLPNGPYFVPTPTILNIFFGEDYFRAVGWAGDNSGSICVNVTILEYNSTCTSNAVGDSPFLDLTRSSVTSTNLRLVVSASTFYSYFSARFSTVNTTCWSDGAGTWWTGPSLETCRQVFTIDQPINNILGSCNFLRDETQPGTTVMSGTLVFTAVHNNGTIRGVRLNTTSISTVQVDVAFSTVNNASTTTNNIFGSIITFATVSSTTLNPTGTRPVLTLTLVTSNQYPYQLVSPLISPVANFTTTMVPVVQDAVNNGSVCNATSLDQYIAGGTCTQTWTITITPVSTCPTQTNFNFNNWNVRFDVRCHSSFSGSCSTPSPSNATVQFVTSSAEYCPTLITQNAVPSLSVNSFQDAAFSIAQGSFVFGTRGFFQAVITSPIAITNAHFERIAIASGGASGVTDLYTKTFTSAGTYFAAGGTFFNGVNVSPTSMLVTDANGAPTFQLNASFSFIWNSNISTAAGDGVVPTTLAIYVRVRYANVTTVGGRPASQLLHFKTNVRPMVQSALAGSLTLAVAAGPSNNGVTGPIAVESGSSSSGVLSTGLSATMFAGVMVVSVVAVIATVAAIMVVQRRNRLKKQGTKAEMEMESTELSTPTVEM